ncbi:MAG: ABC transporter ATP-binding protein, partial [Thermodesulfovibrionia bacterium]|nr:ABC transporter ATP-binding protein [Thermodesulfovibrionia bacterium]
MKKLLNVITNNNPGILKKPVLLEILKSMLQGQPYFVILLVMLELLKPLENPGTGIDFAQLTVLTVWLAASLVLLFIVGRSFYNIENRVAFGVVTEGRLSLGEHLRKLSMGFFKGRDPGDITALMLQDYSNIEMMVSRLLMDVVGALALPVVFSCFLLFFDWRMTLILLAPVPVAILAAVITRIIVLRLGNKHIKAKNTASSRMLEYLDGIKNIKAFNLHGKKFVRLEKAFQNLKRLSIKLEAAAGPSVLLGVWFLNVGIALIMLTGIYFVIEGTLSIPYFLFFLIIGTRMYDPLSRALVSFIELSYYAISANRIKEVFDIKPLPEPAVSRKLSNHNVEFKNVWFRYHETDVLKDVSFSLPENSMTALVGPSGSGKSTITRLIARFWDVSRGEILVGGLAVKKLKNSDLLSNISMVFQDVYLFNDTILNNIKVGKADASMEEVFAAAKKARCHEFIEKLPEGYETMVGEGGATLSGGEKQRVSIARAILKDAPVILLDEATASLDPENELYIQEAIGELIKSRTLIVIAHRLSTIT